MIVMVLAFGVTTIACANDGGTVIITDIPSRFNGMYGAFMGSGRNIELIGAQTFNADPITITGARISNGRVRIPVWTEEGDRFNGSQTGQKHLPIYP